MFLDVLICHYALSAERFAQVLNTNCLKINLLIKTNGFNFKGILLTVSKIMKNETF